MLESWRGTISAFLSTWRSSSRTSSSQRLAYTNKTMASSFLGQLSASDNLSVMSHPAQRHNIDVIEWLIGVLRRCRTFEDYDNFQRVLFQHLHHCEQHRSDCRRCGARLAQGKALPSPLPQLPDDADPNDPETWRVEDLVFDRVCRQLRAVGDALAWRALGYDRRAVIALSSNDSPGPMAGKSGLPHELGAAAELRNSGSLGLLNDLTNCLRIGDITEIKPDGSKLLHEIKSNPNARTGPQRRRMKAAVEAVMDGGELPGRPGNRIVIPSVRCTTHMQTFVSGINDAYARGIAGIGVSDSRALTAVSFPTLAQIAGGVPPEQLLDDFNTERLRAIVQAGISTTPHHVRVSSATRNHDFVPNVTPFALYPLPPLQCALLICDFIIFDITVAPERIVRRLETHGITANIPLPSTNDDLAATDTVITLSKGSRRLKLHPGALYELLIESLDLSSWCAAIAEVIDDPNAPLHPVLAFSTTRVWR